MFTSADEVVGCRWLEPDLGLMESLPAIDNPYLNHHWFSWQWRAIRHGVTRRRAEEDLARVGLACIDRRAVVGELSPADRDGAEIARALRSDPANLWREA